MAIGKDSFDNIWKRITKTIETKSDTPVPPTEKNRSPTPQPEELAVEEKKQGNWETFFVVVSWKSIFFKLENCYEKKNAVQHFTFYNNKKKKKFSHSFLLKATTSHIYNNKIFIFVNVLFFNQTCSIWKHTPLLFIILIFLMFFSFLFCFLLNIFVLKD